MDITFPSTAKASVNISPTLSTGATSSRNDQSTQGRALSDEFTVNIKASSDSVVLSIVPVSFGLIIFSVILFLCIRKYKSASGRVAPDDRNHANANSDGETNQNPSCSTENEIHDNNIQPSNNTRNSVRDSSFLSVRGDGREMSELSVRQEPDLDNLRINPFLSDDQNFDARGNVQIPKTHEQKLNSIKEETDVDDREEKTFRKMKFTKTDDEILLSQSQKEKGNGEQYTDGSDEEYIVAEQDQDRIVKNVGNVARKCEGRRKAKKKVRKGKIASVSPIIKQSKGVHNKKEAKQTKPNDTHVSMSGTYNMILSSFIGQTHV